MVARDLNSIEYCSQHSVLTPIQFLSRHHGAYTHVACKQKKKPTNVNETRKNK